MRTRLAAITLSIALAGCYSPNFKEGLACSETGQCPAGQMCFSDGLCHSEDPGGPGNDAGDGDADDGSDGGIPNGPIKQVVTSQFNTCVLTKDGDVKCWGERLGLGYGPSVIENIGDDETPEAVGFVLIGEPVIALSTANFSSNTCALTESNKVVCWGSTGSAGRSQADFGPFIGDDETPESAGSLDLPAVNQLSTSRATCVIAATLNPTLRCFGSETSVVSASPNTSVLVSLGGTPKRATIGNRTACAILSNSTAKCWGNNHPGIPGMPTIDLADVPANPSINLGEPVLDIAHGTFHHCALLQSGTVHCWGDGASGTLGNQSSATIGDDEDLTAGASVDLGGKKATAICEGCALLEDGSVRCWGPSGRSSFGSTNDVGDDEPPLEVSLGGAAESIACSSNTACAVMAGGTGVRCWGGNATGTLGYGRGTEVLGDEPDELPSMLGDIPLGL